ncbi:glycosyltransferase family 39 protein [Candidatus Pelagibacter sp.]|uniref:glycosyltransferase family 39 protein n=1 Tax=Candidatus Pelagibacter sp. TaxID=2024849 RepID=UPI003F8714FF
MTINNKNINNVFYIFVIAHLIFWTLIPSITNHNLPLDTIEALAWGSNLDWGFNKHPPMSAFFVKIFFQIFGSQDWVYYLLSQIFVIISFYYVFKFSNEIVNNKLLGLVSVLLIEAIYFYNFTTPEFNVNVCQLPFWSLTIYYSWKIYSDKEIKFLDCFLVGLFAAFGFLSKYLFIYLLASIDLLFIYLIFFKKERKFDFKYLITIEAFLVVLVPHFIWLYNNNFITITYGLARTGLEQTILLDHIKYPLIFLLKQIGILVPFFILIWLLVKKIYFKNNFKDKKLLFLLAINILPIVLMFLTSLITGSKIRTMWMTPFYLYFGTLFVYLFQAQINLKKLKPFMIGFVFFFFLSPGLYAYVSISKDDKRTDYPGKEIAIKTQYAWDQQFNSTINVVLGDEWNAGNLSYHLKSRPVWEGFVKREKLDQLKDYMCLDSVCVGSR